MGKKANQVLEYFIVLLFFSFAKKPGIIYTEGQMEVFILTRAKK